MEVARRAKPFREVLPLKRRKKQTTQQKRLKPISI
jgi:hypothetical protein